MKQYYERLAEIMASKRYHYPLYGDLYNDDVSQFLDSRPQLPPLIGIIPMTGEGIDAEVDDLAFIDKDAPLLNLKK